MEFEETEETYREDVGQVVFNVDLEGTVEGPDEDGQTRAFAVVVEHSVVLDTDMRVFTSDGHVDEEAERQLAAEIARETSDLNPETVSSANDHDSDALTAVLQRDGWHVSRYGRSTVTVSIDERAI